MALCVASCGAGDRFQQPHIPQQLPQQALVLDIMALGVAVGNNPLIPGDEKKPKGYTKQPKQKIQKHQNRNNSQQNNRRVQQPRNGY